MKRLILLLAGTALAASPAAAQHSGHDMPGMTMPMPAKKPAAKKPAPKKAAPSNKKKATARKPASKASGAAKRPARSGSTKKATVRKAPAAHDEHDMDQMPGMSMPAGQHAGHEMAPAPLPGPEPGPPPPQALTGPENAADAVYGTASMQPSRNFLLSKEHGGMIASKLLVEELETRFRNGRDGYFVNAQGWYGGDIDKLWFKSEIEGDYGRTSDQLELQALWSHAIDPWFDFQAGVRLDAQPRTRGRLVVGVEGLAPYRWEVGAAAFVSTKGDVTARAEAYHDVRITQKLTLQPRAQLDLALQDIPKERVGSGLSKAELGVRLRYAFVPNFAPYVGVVYERTIGRTAHFARADGEDPGGLQFTVGLRTWF